MYRPAILVSLVNCFQHTNVVDIKSPTSNGRAFSFLCSEWGYFDCFDSGFVNDKTTTSCVENGKAFGMGDTEVKGDNITLKFVTIPYHGEMVIVT